MAKVWPAVGLLLVQNYPSYYYCCGKKGPFNRAPGRATSNGGVSIAWGWHDWWFCCFVQTPTSINASKNQTQKYRGPYSIKSSAEKCTIPWYSVVLLRVLLARLTVLLLLLCHLSSWYKNTWTYQENGTKIGGRLSRRAEEQPLPVLEARQWPGVLESGEEAPTSLACFKFSW